MIVTNYYEKSQTKRNKKYVFMKSAMAFYLKRYRAE